MPTLRLGDISVEVVQKDVKNVHLSVYPPSGADRRMPTWRTFRTSLNRLPLDQEPC